MTDTEFYTTAASLMLYGVDNDDNSMTHHGIKGQQWGRRRYQNSDGSLTELGKKRYKTYEENKKNGLKTRRKCISIGKSSPLRNSRRLQESKLHKMI